MDSLARVEAWLASFKQYLGIFHVILKLAAMEKGNELSFVYVYDILIDFPIEAVDLSKWEALLDLAQLLKGPRIWAG